MAIFISYSHQDRVFVDELAANLVKRGRAHVWVDRWELRVGDSLLQRIQEAMQSAGALIVVLSKASVASEWCRKELSAGLIRELEERRVLVLPVLLEDCDIPLFLRDKLYADFRKSFDDGLRATLEAVAGVTSADVMGRVESAEYHTDWAVDWGYADDRLVIRYVFVDHSEKLPHSLLTEIILRCDAPLTERYRMYESEGLDWAGRLILLEAFWSSIESRDDNYLLLTDNFPVVREIKAREASTGGIVEITISGRRLGGDTGKDVLADWGVHVRWLRDTLAEELTAEQRQRLRESWERRRKRPD